jgi:hypothetical protein
MTRREFVALMGASVTCPFAAMAQQPGRTYRLGCLFPPPRDNPINFVFFDELRRNGFVEGQNLTVEHFRKRHAPKTSSFQFIPLPEARRSPQQSIVRRHRALKL